MDGFATELFFFSILCGEIHPISYFYNDIRTLLLVQNTKSTEYEENSYQRKQILSWGTEYIKHRSLINHERWSIF